MKMVNEQGDFGLMVWRLLSRDGQTEVWALPIMGLGVYMRTVVDGQRENPILLKNVLMLELITTEVDSQILGPDGQPTGEPTFRCLNRELLTLDLAKKRFMPKGKPVQPGLEVYAGALLTQEHRARPQMPSPELVRKIAETGQDEAANEARP